VVLTGDLLARPEGAERLRGLIERLPPVYAVLGNHDFADSRDPFSKPVGEVDLGRGTLLGDESVTLDLRGRRVQLVGVDPRTYMRWEARPWELVEPDADLRILLSHFPRIVDRLPGGAFDLVLPATCTTARSACRTAAARCGSRTRALRTTKGSTTGREPCCTCRPGSARPSSHSGSSLARRPPS
jgi:hypothetical protein